jgi:hypothetical protein
MLDGRIEFCVCCKHEILVLVFPGREIDGFVGVCQ